MRLTRRGALSLPVLLATTSAAGAEPRRSPGVRSWATREITQTLQGMPTSDGAGVQLQRVIGQPALRHLDPFLMLDRFHSDDPGAYIAGFPDHPHRGFETVTIMRAGRMRHRDSRGNSGIITGGGVQWMTAGRGIVHSEMPEQEAGLMSGFQLWINLPAAQKLVEPAYQDLQPSRLAEFTVGPGASRLRLAAGRLQGRSGPVRARPTEPLLATVSLEDDRPVEIELPTNHTAFVFVAGGEIAIGGGDGRSVTAGSLALLGPGNRIRLRAANRRSELLLAAGRPLGEPIVQRGPFVMNTEAEIARAIDDYRAGRLGR